MPKSSPVGRYIYATDPHFPYHDEPAIRCLLKAIEIVKPDGFIWGGDVGEFESAGHWQWKKKRRPPLEFQLPLVDADIAAVNAGMDRIDEALDKANVKVKHFMEGNHDDWLNRLVVENPFLERTSHKYGKGYLFKDAVGLKRRGYKFHPVGKMLHIGHCYFYHGHHHGGIHHAKNHLLKMGVNVMYGHWHDIQQASVTHIDGQKSAWSMGCLKRLDHEANEWLERRPVNWGHAFATVDYFGKDFSVNVHRIVDGRVSVYGELVDGN